ncbi:unnamed protein product [Lactuca saligna]|uniref:Uncharacterized protein n=1 Tax=Lactuca saligna TaxID=75948 RepID=A0AA36A3C2_LACSI|nr:unnamed protein product [Lactuca saligna]
MVVKKSKVDPSVGESVSKKYKNLVQKSRSPSLVIQDDSDERTKSEVHGDNVFQNNEEDTSHTFEPPTFEMLVKVSSPPSSSILQSNIFYSIMKEPFINLTTRPCPPPFNPPTLLMNTSPLTTSIPISSIPILLKMSSVETSQPQISIAFPNPIFADSTIPST